MQNNRINVKKHENKIKNLYYMLEKKKAMYEVAISKFWVNILYIKLFMPIVFPCCCYCFFIVFK